MKKLILILSVFVTVSVLGQSNCTFTTCAPFVNNDLRQIYGAIKNSSSSSTVATNVKDNNLDTTNIVLQKIRNSLQSSNDPYHYNVAEYLYTVSSQLKNGYLSYSAFSPSNGSPSYFAEETKVGNIYRTYQKDSVIAQKISGTLTVNVNNSNLSTVAAQNAHTSILNSMNTKLNSIYNNIASTVGSGISVVDNLDIINTTLQDCKNSVLNSVLTFTTFSGTTLDNLMTDINIWKNANLTKRVVRTNYLVSVTSYSVGGVNTLKYEAILEFF